MRSKELEARIPALRSWFEENFRERGDHGASVSIWLEGVEVLSLHQGAADREETRAWDEQTLVPVWSATKGPAAVTTLLALLEAGLAPGSDVRELWPELRAAQSPGLSFDDVLCHRAGLAALDHRESLHVRDYQAVIAALEAQEVVPPEKRGGRHAYHAKTYGYLLDEVVRRASGARSLGEFWKDRFADPLGIEFWIGLPEAHHHRVAETRAVPITETPDLERDFFAAYLKSDSLTRAAFGSPPGLERLSELNRPDFWQLGLPALGGVGSARGLAQFYSILAANGRWHEASILPAPLMEWLEAPPSEGFDEVLRSPNAFARGLMKDPLREDGTKLRQLFGPSIQAHGHPGRGGSLAFADPEQGLAFAYTMSQLVPGVFPNARALGLVALAYGRDPVNETPSP